MTDKKPSISSINWFPGHMKKTKEEIAENLKLIDVIVEVIDARAPLATRNPDLEKTGTQKLRILLLNKEDLADPAVSNAWIRHYESNGVAAFSVNALSTGASRKIMSMLEKEAIHLYEDLARKGRRKRALRVMIAGIPNAGKSSVINRIIGKKSARTGDKPGVTRGKQWVRVRKDIELLDTPGILWPKIEDPLTGLKLAWIGSIPDPIMDAQLLVRELLAYLATHFPEQAQAVVTHILEQEAAGALKKLLEQSESLIDSKALTELIIAMAHKRGHLISQGEVDYQRFSQSFLQEYRAGKFGRISLELPPVSL